MLSVNSTAHNESTGPVQTNFLMNKIHSLLCMIHFVKCQQVSVLFKILFLSYDLFVLVILLCLVYKLLEASGEDFFSWNE